MPNMKILLVNPPVNRLCDIPVNYFPLGLGYLAGITNRMGFNTYIYNAELETRKLPFANNKRRLENHKLFIQALKDDSHFVWKEFREILKRLNPSIVGFSCTSASILPCQKMAEEAKTISNSITVFGGMHPTILPEETARLKFIDYVIVGDAEESFPAFVGSIAQGKEPIGIPGVGAYMRDKFRFVPAEPLERNIDIFPFPDRNAMIDKERHIDFFQAMVASRGCPFKCTFCSGRNITDGIVRYRSVENIIEEIKFLKGNYGVGHIVFYDDALVLNKRRVTELCHEIIKQNIKITWGGFTRADSVDRAILRLMKTAGCIYLGIGVESGSDRTLARIKKGYTREKAIKGVRLIRDSGIEVSINIIIGFPFETAEDIRDSISLIKELDVPANINTFTPYPKSELYDECVRRGLVKHDIDWSSISQHSPYNEFIQEISPVEYRKLLWEMVSVADKIFNKINNRNKFHRIRRIHEVWHEEGRHPIKFIKVIADKIIVLLKQNFHKLRSDGK